MMDEKERRKAEVRARLEAQVKKKRGFMTPERKKRLRNLLRKKAGEELKKEQERKEKERRRIIGERTGNPKKLDGNEATLTMVINQYYKRILALEGDKFDLEHETSIKEFQLKELMEKVNDRSGKFVVPPLKKVSKTANQLEKIRMFTARVAQFDYRTSLKQVAKKEYQLEDSDLEKKTEAKPEWADKTLKNKTASTSEAVSEAVSEVASEAED